MRWVVSIGFALRSDVVYPEDLSPYGTSEAEQKFNWVVSKYDKISKLMARHRLVKDLYGSGTTWFVRNNLGFRSPVVMGEHWLAIGDATGFTNPLYSPGINANMGISIYAAEMTNTYLSLKSCTGKRKLLTEYEEFCRNRIPNLQRMNTFNYVCMRSPDLGPLGPLWQYLIGTGNKAFQNARTFEFGNCKELLARWDWGVNEEEYIALSNMVIAMLAGRCDEELSTEQIEGVKGVSRLFLNSVMSKGKYRGRWSGLLRYYDDELKLHREKVDRDVLASRCRSCGEWKMLQGDVRKCPFCGYQHTIEESTKKIYVGT
ncbi:hypothetical protein GLAREA_03881 [Glarea lozoyensis ATCC 20868]|uniref:Uncharacterized protein n=1 Tax=Glarea lozoyensis (strain ATCC 20868 / MF5171) TaxID=1116229 RepID=S3D182_GLAL2|nr:uncharacterized protein GLAREA_03881 [Glarea lozoyensis ATCC 20868]EPE30914.1 hypothetical protein GLAREA_03881 [Glarea lozoyensis ATCC 20868]